MSNILTIPLKKSLPALMDASSQTEWEQVLCGFLNDSQKDISDIILAFEKNVSILEHQKTQTSILIGILEECGGLSVRARNMMSTEADKHKYQKNISEFEDWFKIALVKLDKAVENSEYQGINLMNGGSLTTLLDKKGQTKLTTEGINLTSAALGIRAPDFSTVFSTQNARIDVMNAMDMVVTVRNTIASHINTLKVGIDVAMKSTELSKTVQPTLGRTNILDETKSLKALIAKGHHILGDEPLANPSQQETLTNFASSPLMEDI
jgi:hypothetical protein